MKIRTKYTFNSNIFPFSVLFQCFGMLQVLAMRFYCANGLVVLRSCTL